jgi:5-methylcytosine-specific restriction enzyme A
MPHQKGSERAERDARYAAKARLHPDYPFWRSREWRDKIRIAALLRQPFCVKCGAPAKEVDHIQRPLGDRTLQTDPANMQSLCRSCHAKKTRAVVRGFSTEIDADGYPIDPAHPANQPRGASN